MASSLGNYEENFGLVYKTFDLFVFLFSYFSILLVFLLFFIFYIFHFPMLTLTKFSLYSSMIEAAEFHLYCSSLAVIADWTN